VRLFRAQLPPPETLSASAPVTVAARREPAERSTGHAKKVGAKTAGEWFRIGVGRRRNADPRWLLPMICRVGGVTRQDIGAIRVFDHETRFEVAQGALANFCESLRRSGETEYRIEPAEPKNLRRRK
jgi:ATP-dependent RNA helicase DeaD